MSSPGVPWLTGWAGCGKWCCQASTASPRAVLAEGCGRSSSFRRLGSGSHETSSWSVGRTTPRGRHSVTTTCLWRRSRALTDFALRHDSERDVRAVLVAGVQRREVTTADLESELLIASSRGRSRLVRVLDELRAGVRSAPEGDVRKLVRTSRVLPQPLFNCLLQFPCGRRVSPDLLVEEAALIQCCTTRHGWSRRAARASCDSWRFATNETQAKGCRPAWCYCGEVRSRGPNGQPTAGPMWHWSSYS